MDDERDLLGFILPKTVVGLALWLLIFALGAGASGVVFFVAYERRTSELDARIASVRSELEQKLADAVTELRNADRQSQAGVTGTGTSGPAGDATAVLTKVGPSVAVVQGADAAGARTSGSGFVMNSTANQSWLLTSYRLVAGSIAAAQGETPPAAPLTLTVTVHLAGADRAGTVYSWDAAHDLALVIVDIGSVPTLQFSSAVPATGLGVWAVGSATGQYGATAAKGKLLGSSAQSLSTDAVFGPRASGGPLVDGEGKVMGVLTASRTSGPTSTTPTGPTGLAIPVRMACAQVVICPR